MWEKKMKDICCEHGFENELLASIIFDEVPKVKRLLEYGQFNKVSSFFIPLHLARILGYETITSILEDKIEYFRVESNGHSLNSIIAKGDSK
jgi:hypothetical protein